jgi:hypothetical protein
MDVMTRTHCLLLALTLVTAFAVDAKAQSNVTELPGSDQYARDAKQPIDEEYTQRIKKYTTDPSFNSPLTDYLPASTTVPTPAKILGDVAGAPDMLPYAADVYRYFRLLEASSPRVKVVTIGHSEEGREMIAVAVADEPLLGQMKANDERLAKLSDPRTIAMNDKTAAGLVSESFPVYYITGTIHSPETGAPTALMELAYRLVVDDAPYIQYIRTHQITLITPVVEVDGRDRMVDLYRWHKAHPGENYPRLIYWGHYVAHDNNRDAMAMTLNLTNNVLTTYLGWHAQVLHDLHESVPFLYDNTVGDGPYNAWIDPMLADEWGMLGWNNVQQMQKFGMPGVFTHGDFDTWSPGYLMFLAGLHNGISRLYETFGNGGADTERRILDPDEYSKTWYRQNPPLPTVMWSQRDNNNYEQSALLSTLSYFSHNSKQFLENYYLKSKRSIEKPADSGPAAYVLPFSEGEWNRQVHLLRVLAAQHVELHRLNEAATVTIPPVSKKKHDDADKDDVDAKGKAKPEAAAHPQTFPPGSYVIRMDQPYSRVADALLDRQYWSPEDPQKHPYDDTGWSFGELFRAGSVRVTDRSILSAKMTKVDDLKAKDNPVSGSGAVYVIGNSGQTSLASFRYALKNANISVAEAGFDAAGHHFEPGSLLVADADAPAVKAALNQCDLHAYGLAAMPKVATHTIGVPRVAMMHTWLSTQTEGWWREAFDKLQVPYDYISTQTVSRESDLRAKYDVIVFAPVGHSRNATTQIVDGLPMWGNALPWQTTSLTPNLGKIDSTEDMRPGLGATGVVHLREFVRDGGLLITVQDTAQFAIDSGLAPGVFVVPPKDAKVVGTILSSVVVGKSNPVAYGFEKELAVYSESGMAFSVSNLTTGDSRIVTEKDYKRPTGRGGPDDEESVQGRLNVEAEALPAPKPWQPAPLNEEQLRNNPFVIPAEYRPEVVVRYAEGKKLLLSGLLEHGDSLAERAVVVDAHLGKGNVLLFANNPIYRGETIGTYALVFNAILNYEHLRPTVAVVKK